MRLSAKDVPILHEQFALQAAQTPNEVALWSRGSSITFAALNERASRLAALLRSRGIRDGFVGLHAERSIEYVVAVLGILKANCAVVPLPPSYPAGRLRQILDFAQLDAVVDVDASPIDQRYCNRVIRLSDSADVAPDAQVVGEDVADRPAFVLSSSGSTGHPKLIVRSHRSFFHRLQWTWEQHPFDAGEVCVQKSFMTTTHAIYELFEPILRGVPVHIIPNEEVRNLAAFWNGLEQRGVSRLLIVPSVLQASLEIPSLAPPPLKLLVLMGEHVPTKLAARAIEAFPESTTIVSIYGSTEASSALVCDVRAAYRHGEELPLGVPISGDVHAAVLDDALAPVAEGASGMLYLAGPELFTEYYREPALTVSTLIERDGQSLYRTQDVVRSLPRGDLQFVTRADDTVKVRGFRVDPREVERAIAFHPDVFGCVVLSATDANGTGSSSLVAFVTPASLEPRDVLRTARERLPSYMVPSSVVSLDAFPLTASGKVDRRTLLAEFAAAPTAARAAFESDTERLIAAVWADVLGHRRFGRADSFFDVGGTSLTVFTVEHRLRTSLSLDRTALSSATIYRYPVLDDLASHVDRVLAGEAPADAVDTILVTLKRGTNSALPPLFLISSAGGTLGAYAKLANALGGEREIIGVRDPFLWGARDPSQGFQAWVSHYVDAIRKRQSGGPYYIAAYSSAGAFAYEIARRLRAMGHEVALLALIDPLALDRGTKRRFGYWAFEARFRSPMLARVLRTAGQLRRAMPRRMLNGALASDSDWKLSNEQLERFAKETRNDRHHIRRLAALLELNTGLPFGLSEPEMSAVDPDARQDLLIGKILSVAPETDADMMKRLVVQYELQVRSHHNYELRPYDGALHLFEPAGPYAGLESAQLRPYVRRLRDCRLSLGATSAESAVLADAFPQQILSHYLCMRDDAFVAQLARELGALMR